MPGLAHFSYHTYNNPHALEIFCMLCISESALCCPYVPVRILLACTSAVGCYTTNTITCLLCCLLTPKLLTLQGRMCLLLGPPGSGKSSLLKILAGKIRGNKLVQVSYTRPHTVGPHLSYLQSTAMYSRAQAEHHCHAEEQTFHKWQKLLQACVGLAACFGRYKGTYYTTARTSVNSWWKGALDMWSRQISTTLH